MHSMSKEFYNYISDKLINFFINGDIHIGDKYFIEFDKENQVKELYTSLRECSNNFIDVNANDFSYPSSSGSTYETYSLDIGKKFKVVVADSSSVTVDYLVTLRNAVTDQEDVWKNTVLMVICFESIDSIQKGMKSLQKEGMPLNFRTIAGNLTKELKSSGLSKINREIIKFDLDQKSDDFDSTLWDYEYTLGMINRGEITSDDLKYLQLFSDKGLDESFRSSKIRKRLEDNHKDYEDVFNDHQYDNVEDRLNKRFNDVGTTALKGKNWQDVDYTNVLKSANENIDSYVGKKVRITGYVYRLIDFDDTQFVVARDMKFNESSNSIIVGFLCESKEASKYADGTWVEVIGTIKKGRFTDELAVLDVVTIKETDKPENIFVNPPDKTYIPTTNIF